MSNVRGTVLLRVVKLLRARRERALAVIDASLHGYLNERINVRGWYPATHYFELLRSCITLLPDPASAYDLLGAGAARADMSGIYRSLLRSGDVARTLRSLVQLWRDQYDVGTLEVAFDDAAGATISLRENDLGTPRFCEMLAAYMRESATLAGAHEVRVYHHRCQARGGPTCAWRITWDTGDVSGRSLRADATSTATSRTVPERSSGPSSTASKAPSSRFAAR